MLREALFLILSGAGLIILLIAGIPLGQWQWLAWTGYHASHWNTAFAYLVYLMVGVPFYLVCWAQCFRWFFVRRGAKGENKVRLGRDLSSAGITAGVVTISLIAGGFYLFVLAPLTAGLQHSYHDWPAALQLTEFQVCATEVKMDWEQAEQARGNVAFEIVNLSPAVLREATFTLEAGRYWGAPRVHRYDVRDLAPRAKQRIEVEVDLGRITRETQTNVAPTRLSARLYYGRVQFEGERSVAVTRRPVTAETKIGDCPKFQRVC